MIRIAIITLLNVSACLLFSCGSGKKPDTKPGGGGAAGGGGGGNRNAPVRVEGFVVSPQTISETAEVPGTLLPFEETELHPEVSGRVVQLNVREGQFVSRGALLLKIFDGDLQAQLKKLQVQLATAEKTVERQTELLKINGISQQEVDLNILSANTIKADIDIIRTSIAKTELRAPFSGRVGLKNISTGAYVTPATIVTTIREMDNLKIDFTVPEKYSSRINIGMPINFTIEGSPTKYHAKVVANENSVTEANRSLKVRAIVAGKDKYMVPGAFAKVNLMFGKDNNALMIPTQAVLPQARDKKVILYKDGIAKFITVTTGIRDSARVQVTSGLEAGDTIVTTGLLTIKPEAKLNMGKVTGGKGQ